MSKGNIVLGVLAGAAIGVVLGVLFAPDKGSETRKKIAKKTSDGADELKGKFNDLLASITENLESFKEEAEDLSGKTKSGPIKNEI